VFPLPPGARYLPAQPGFRPAQQVATDTEGNAPPVGMGLADLD
jgi:hypothetical protein